MKFVIGFLGGATLLVLGIVILKDYQDAFGIALIGIIWASAHIGISIYTVGVLTDIRDKMKE